MLLGSMMLFSAETPYVSIRISPILIIGSLIFTAGFFLLLLSVGVRALRAKPVSGVESLVGKWGIAKSDLDPSGIVLVEGEDWKAESVSGRIAAGESVTVVSVAGLTLSVRK